MENIYIRVLDNAIEFFCQGLVCEGRTNERREERRITIVG